MQRLFAKGLPAFCNGNVLNILAFVEVNLLVSYQLAQAEKEEIILFESHLAAATTKVTITESNSLLLSQLISMDPV